MSTGVPRSSSNSGNLRQIRHRIHGGCDRGKKGIYERTILRRSRTSKGISMPRSAKFSFPRATLCRHLVSLKLPYSFLFSSHISISSPFGFIGCLFLLACTDASIPFSLDRGNFPSPEGRKTDRKFRWNCWKRVSDTEKNLSSQPVGSSLSLFRSLSLSLLDMNIVMPY